MEDEAEEIAGAEEEGVGAGFEAGEVFAVDDYDAGEAEVDLWKCQSLCLFVTLWKVLTEALSRAGAMVRQMR